MRSKLPVDDDVDEAGVRVATETEQRVVITSAEPYFDWEMSEELAAVNQ